MAPGRNLCLSVTIVRHAETDQNALVPRVLQGQSDNAINAVGMKQAELLAWRLKRDEFDHIYTSDLIRAKLTSYEIAKHHAKTPLAKDQRLREQDLGDLTGLAWPAAKQILKDEDRSFEDHVAEKGESNRRFKDRVVDFYTNLIECHLVEPHEQLLRASSSSDMLASIAAAEENANGRGGAPGSDGSLPSSSSQPHQSQSSSTSENGTSRGGGGGGGGGGLSASSTDSLAAAGANGNMSTRNPRNTPRMRKVNILLVTHGGWIQRLMEHLLEDLNFTPECELQHGFPKNTAAYKFTISKAYQPDGDYEWEGRVTLMNCVAHLAGMSKDLGASAAANASGVAAGIVGGIKSYVWQNGKSPAGSPVMLRKARARAMATADGGGVATGVSGRGGTSQGLAFNKKGLIQMFSQVGKPPGLPMPETSATRVKSLGW
ncbi:hypothetical protein HDU87_002779 [Geranomyces variabilis]|uniref:Phosphoglycerate mutase-like protein n=1 Tax=Geranomyces variabilis TaxID=109894 RepID=A0AAD5TKS3_9FUNG|nr:hypothetical protein HDU87_002779 [Geranomyces variabilis]